jgi:hypothetical protein
MSVLKWYRKELAVSVSSATVLHGPVYMIANVTVYTFIENRGKVQ